MHLKLEISLSCLFGVAFFILSCSEKPDSDQQALFRAEQVMNEYPDSALLALETIYAPELLSPKEYANYCLLMTQAKDKSYLPLKDTLIRSAVSYFEHHKNKRKKAEAYFYLGRTCYQNNCPDEAMLYYQQALDDAMLDDDPALIGLIHNHIGNLEVDQMLFDQSIESFLRSIHSFSLVGNTEKKLFNYLDIAKVYLHKQQLDSAYFYFEKAETAVMLTGNKKLQAGLLNDIGYFYLDIGNLKLSRNYIQRSLELENDSIELSKKQLILGKINICENQIDSAKYYFLSAQKLTSNLFVQAAAWNNLYEMEVKLGNWKDAIGYNEQFLSCKDSIDRVIIQAEVYKVEEKYNHEKLRNEYQLLKIAFKNKQLNVYHLIFLFLICLIVICSIYFRKSQKKNMEILEHKNTIITSQEKEMNTKAMEDKLRTRIFAQTHIAGKLQSMQPENVFEKKFYDKIRKIYENPLTNASKEELFQEMNAAFNNFVIRLKTHYPFLTENELILCCLIRINMQNSQLAYVFNISPSSISTNKYRIKKRLDPDKLEPDLESFLKNF